VPDDDCVMTGGSNLQVLLVEDSTVICNLIANIINNVAGVSVAESVGSEADAIEAVNHGNVDVVILDLQLRSGTGFGVLRAMRRMAKRPDVVVLTNFALGTYRESALALGARHFLDKSRDYERLPGILTELAAARAS
jgi:two-component system, OmpR family, response regulator